jgi:hypothetical protein
VLAAMPLRASGAPVARATKRLAKRIAIRAGAGEDRADGSWMIRQHPGARQ